MSIGLWTCSPCPALASKSNGAERQSWPECAEPGLGFASASSQMAEGFFEGGDFTKPDPVTGLNKASLGVMGHFFDSR
jgi:hypothetical protein